MFKSFFTLNDPAKKPIYVYLSLWIGTYIVRFILATIYGWGMFADSRINFFLLWLGGVFFGLFVSKIIMYKRHITRLQLMEADLDPMIILNIINGNKHDYSFIEDRALSPHKRLYVYKNDSTGRMYGLYYRIDDRGKIIDEEFEQSLPFEVTPAERTVTVYDPV